jgi:outer membrane protein insertion porin family
MYYTPNKKLYRILFFIFLITISFQIYPQGQRTAFKVLGVTVEGNKFADSPTIIASSGIRVGDEIQVPGDQTLNAIRNLWSLGIFSDVQIIVDKQVGDGVFLIIKVAEYPKLEKVIYEGNDDISNSDIDKQITFIRGQTIKPQDISKLEQRILKLYNDEGFLNAEIKSRYYIYSSADTVDGNIFVIWMDQKDFSDEYEMEYPSGDQRYTDLISRIRDRVLIRMQITEGDKVTVRKIEFTGNDAFDDGDLRGEMDGTSEKKWWKFWSGAKFNPEEYKKDKELIINYFRKNGYLDAEILSDSLIYYNNNRDLHIVMNMYEGPQYRIRNITWEGNTVYPSEVLSERLEFAKGDVFNYEKFEQNLRGNEKQTDVSALYLDNGYLTFNVQPRETRVPVIR